jgi:hypothetical protein
VRGFIVLVVCSRGLVPGFRRLSKCLCVGTVVFWGLLVVVGRGSLDVLRSVG